MPENIYRKKEKTQTIEEDWGSLTWLANQELTDSSLTLGRVNIKKGHSNPCHKHNNCEEILYLLAGKLDHLLGEKHIILNPGDTIIIPPEVEHYAKSIGDENADMIVAYNSGVRDFQVCNQ